MASRQSKQARLNRMIEDESSDGGAMMLMSQNTRPIPAVQPQPPSPPPPAKQKATGAPDSWFKTGGVTRRTIRKRKRSD